MMKAHELMEQASLDAYGLLDEQEQASFDRTLASCPPAIAAQVRREQLRVAKEGLHLPDVDPPAGLRSRVLAAMRLQSAGDAERDVYSMPEILPSRGVHPVWRLAAIASVAASVVLGMGAGYLHLQYRDINSALTTNQVNTQIAEEFGARFTAMFMSEHTRLHAFVRADDGLGVEAALMNNPEMGGAIFAVHGFPPSETASYTLAVVSSDGQILRTLTSFRPLGSGFSSYQIRNADLNTGTRLVVLPAGATSADEALLTLTIS